MRTLVVLGLGVLFGCNSGAAKPEQQSQQQRPRDARTADADPGKLDGQALYMGYCANCHGTDGKGYKADNAPSLVNKTFLESADDEFLKRSIAAGRPGTSMAAYSAKVGGPFDDAALDRLVAYIRAQGPAAQPLPAQAMNADATAGEQVYNEHCIKCHGNQGTRSSAVHLANPQFLAIATDPFLRHAIVHGRPGTPMEAFADKLKPADIDNVVAFIRSYQKKTQEAGLLPPPTGTEPLVINPKGKDPVWKKLRRDPGSTVDRYVSVDEVKKAYDEKRKMVIVDARPASDWMRARITGAVSIPYHDLSRLKDIPKDVWVIAYCACPHHLSGDVVNALIARGHTKALVLDEGILEWHRRGYPVTAAPGVMPPPKEGGVHGHHGHSHGHEGHNHP